MQIAKWIIVFVAVFKFGVEEYLEILESQGLWETVAALALLYSEERS